MPPAGLGQGLIGLADVIGSFFDRREILKQQAFENALKSEQEQRLQDLLQSQLQTQQANTESQQFGDLISGIDTLGGTLVPREGHLALRGDQFGVPFPSDPRSEPLPPDQPGPVLPDTGMALVPESLSSRRAIEQLKASQRTNELLIKGQQGLEQIGARGDEAARVAGIHVTSRESLAAAERRLEQQENELNRQAANFRSMMSAGASIANSQALRDQRGAIDAGRQSLAAERLKLDRLKSSFNPFLSQGAREEIGGIEPAQPFQPGPTVDINQLLNQVMEFAGGQGGGGGPSQVITPPASQEQELQSFRELVGDPTATIEEMEAFLAESPQFQLRP